MINTMLKPKSPNRSQFVQTKQSLKTCNNPNNGFLGSQGKVNNKKGLLTLLLK
jgi:hypothetical protein